MDSDVETVGPDEPAPADRASTVPRRLRLAGRPPLERTLVLGCVVALAGLGTLVVAHATGLVGTGLANEPLARAAHPVAAVLVLAAGAAGVAALVGRARDLDPLPRRVVLAALALAQLWIAAGAHSGVSLGAALADATALGVVDPEGALLPGLRTDLAWVASWCGIATAFALAFVGSTTIDERPRRLLALAVGPEVALVFVVAVWGIDLRITDAATGLLPGSEVLLRDLPVALLTNALFGLAVPVTFLFMFEALETSRLSRDLGQAVSLRGVRWGHVEVVLAVKVAGLAVGFALFGDDQAWEAARTAGPWSWVLATAAILTAGRWLASRRRTPDGLGRAVTPAGLAVIGGWMLPIVGIAVLLVAMQVLPTLLPSSRGGVAALAGAGLLAAGVTVVGPGARRLGAAAVAVSGAAGLLWWSTGTRNDVVETTTTWRASIDEPLVSAISTLSDNQVTIQAVVLLALVVAIAWSWRRRRGLALALLLFWAWNLARMVDVLCLTSDVCALDLSGWFIRPVQLDVLVTAAGIVLALRARRGHVPVGPAAAAGALVAATVALHAGSLVLRSTAAGLFYAGLLLPTAYLLLFDATELNVDADDRGSPALATLGILVASLAVVTLQLLSGQVTAGDDNAGDVAAALLLVPLTAALLAPGLRGTDDELWHDALPPRPEVPATT